MSSEPQQVEFAHSKFDKVMGTLTLALWAGALYYSMDPDGFERSIEKLRSLRDRARHRASVWEAIAAIRSLPTTDITDITDT